MIRFIGVTRKKKNLKTKYILLYSSIKYWTNQQSRVIFKFDIFIQLGRAIVPAVKSRIAEAKSFKKKPHKNPIKTIRGITNYTYTTIGGICKTSHFQNLRHPTISTSSKTLPRKQTTAALLFNARLVLTWKVAGDCIVDRRKLCNIYYISLFVGLRKGSAVYLYARAPFPATFFKQGPKI